MPAKVVDASVLAAVAFGEPRADEATACLSGAEFSMLRTSCPTSWRASPLGNPRATLNRHVKSQTHLKLC